MSGYGESRVVRFGGKLVVSHAPHSQGSLSGAKSDGEPPLTLRDATLTSSLSAASKGSDARENVRL